MYADYLSWLEDERIEIIAGVPYLQAAPARLHQEVLSSITSPFTFGICTVNLSYFNGAVVSYGQCPFY
ncbi:hypothetical protein [Gracilibacillus lacisalsi]|uniref:hypothetical protein n=1 Tax=Gracilibacillus lacisalsi TaxID=393087 RepID=UPI000370C5CE|nr:hypothetical protein [Gracilibacillus lacisalsi]